MHEAIIVIKTSTSIFSRGVGLDAGLRSLNEDDLVFLMDVDMQISWSIVDKCRRIVHRGLTAWLPISFSQFNPELVCSSSYEDSGYWRKFGYGMACLYKSDYIESGGFDLSIQGWGGEDVLLCKSLLKHNIQVIRNEEIDLVHIFHHKHCHAGSVGKHAIECRKSKFEHYGSKHCISQIYWSRFKNVNFTRV